LRLFKKYQVAFRAKNSRAARVKDPHFIHDNSWSMKKKPALRWLAFYSPTLAG
jgi:hypothetical protein